MSMHYVQKDYNQQHKKFKIVIPCYTQRRACAKEQRTRVRCSLYGYLNLGNIAAAMNNLIFTECFILYSKLYWCLSRIYQKIIFLFRLTK